jgi:hypothetical protein
MPAVTEGQLMPPVTEGQSMPAVTGLKVAPAICVTEGQSMPVICVTEGQSMRLDASFKAFEPRARGDEVLHPPVRKAEQARRRDRRPVVVGLSAVVHGPILQPCDPGPAGCSPDEQDPRPGGIDRGPR